MDDSADPTRTPAAAPPSLPAVHSPSPEVVLDSVPSTAEVVANAKTADDIVAGQPSVDDLLGPNRRR
jgi:hypothetical protein